MARRSSKDTLKSSDYLPCVHCYGFFCKKELWQHSRKCTSENTVSKELGVIARSKLLLVGGLDSDVEREDFVES